MESKHAAWVSEYTYKLLYEMLWIIFLLLDSKKCPTYDRVKLSCNTCKVFKDEKKKKDLGYVYTDCILQFTSNWLVAATQAGYAQATS